MAICKNTDFIHNGERYHVQTESWAPQEQVIVTQVFRLGKIIYTLRFLENANHNFSTEDVEEAHKQALINIKELLI